MLHPIIDNDVLMIRQAKNQKVLLHLFRIYDLYCQITNTT